MLEHREAILAPRRRLLADALKVVAQWQAKEAHRLDWVVPNAGALCCMRLKPEAFSDVAVTRFWDSLSNYDLLLGTGSWFGESDRIFRLGFGYLPIEQLEPALEAVSAAMDQTLATSG